MHACAHGCHGGGIFVVQFLAVAVHAGCAKALSSGVAGIAMPPKPADDSDSDWSDVGPTVYGQVHSFDGGVWCKTFA